MNQHDDPIENHPNADDFDEFFTLRELAELLRVQEATVRYWRNQGTGPDSYKIGRHVRYSHQDVDRWLRAQRSTSGHGAA